MMTRKMWVAVVLLVPALLAAFATPVSAQGNAQATLSCSGGPDQIKPLGAPGSWDCNARVQFPQNVGDPVTFFTITITEQSPPWANVIIAPAALTVQSNPSGEQVQQVPFSVSVALTSNAPAFEATKVTLDGSATSGGSAQTMDIAPTQLTVTPGYFNLYNVRLEQKIGQGGPQDSVQFPIQIDNFSNGDTRFTFALVAPDSVPGGFSPVVPEPLVLESKASGGETTQGQVTFSVYTPYQNGYVNEVGAIQLTVDSAYAPDSSISGASAQVSTLTQARGFYVPGLGAPLVAIGLLGAALTLQRVVIKDE